jgi:hypothetical protein
VKADTVIAIYQLDGKYPLIKWLCEKHRKARLAADWTVKPGGAPGALVPTTCDDCFLEVKP